MLKNVIRSLLRPDPPGTTIVQSGLQHFISDEHGRPIRYHLRVEPDGAGLLVANATQALRLSPTGVFIAQALFAKRSVDAIVHQLTLRFGKGHDIAGDVKRVMQAVADLGAARGGVPLRDLDDPGMDVLRRTLSAPFRAELTLPEIDQGEQILRRLWQIGIPHVVLVTPPHSRDNDMLRLIELAEDLGLIAGLRACASTLTNDDLLAELINVGLDHLNLYWLGADAAMHDAVYGAGDHEAFANAVQIATQHKLHVVAMVPVVDDTLERLDELLGELPSQGIHHAELFCLVAPKIDGALDGPELTQTVVIADEVADTAQLAVSFAQPVALAERTTLAEAMRAGPRSSGSASIRIDAQGNVIPPTGPNKAVGNLLTDDWAQIWGHAAFTPFREAVTHQLPCIDCPGHSTHGVCVKDPNNWAHGGAA